MFIIIITIFNAYLKAWHLQKSEKIRLFQHAYGYSIAVLQMITVIGIISEMRNKGLILGRGVKQCVGGHTGGKKSLSF